MEKHPSAKFYFSNIIIQLFINIYQDTVFQFHSKVHLLSILSHETQQVYIQCYR